MKSMRLQTIGAEIYSRGGAANGEERIEAIFAPCILSELRASA
jgi:hypothetical protein